MITTEQFTKLLYLGPLIKQNAIREFIPAAVQMAMNIEVNSPKQF